jgi:predicted chitinase
MEHRHANSPKLYSWGLTSQIDGGNTGLDDRIVRIRLAMKALGVS